MPRPNSRNQVTQETSAEELFDLEISQADEPVKMRKQEMPQDSHAHALQTVRRASQWAIAAGLIPVPLLDSVGVTGVQVKMVFDLCKIYNVPFKKESAYAVIVGLLTSIIASGAAQGLKKIILTSAPVVGSAITLMTEPVLCYAATVAVGSVFIRHFENNGTLTNFDFTGMKHILSRHFDQASQSAPTPCTATH